MQGIKQEFWCPDQGTGSLSGHQTGVLVPQSRLRLACRALNRGFGALIGASAGLQGIKQEFWCPDQGTGSLSGHQTGVLLPQSRLRLACRALNRGFGALIGASAGLQGIKQGR
ncbi:hypothetical protein [Ammoniphilus sp. YIM 78166]|uniref:hypothetical protein n=1 Tax=Ammoniphilus sp. YIM 78166 TaxID=1644106 RepID=UPI00142F4D5D|nr:hypothetical protein [Ammoniphilus sp. YIM 78166]